MACWQADLKGINEAKNYWQAYFDKYTYEHEVLAGAADKEAIVAFSFWLDKVTLHAQQICHKTITDFGHQQNTCLFLFVVKAIRIQYYLSDAHGLVSRCPFEHHRQDAEL